MNRVHNHGVSGPGVQDLRSSPVTSAVGTVIEGVDLSRALEPEEQAFIHRCLVNHGVVFFRNQELSDEQMQAFVSHFGEPTHPPFLKAMSRKTAEDPDLEGDIVTTRDVNPAKTATAVWHSDTTFLEKPPRFTILRTVKIPPYGGDTCWSSMYAAYDALSKPMQKMLDGLTAVHSVIPVLQRMGSMAQRFEGSGDKTSLEGIQPVICVHPDSGRKALFVNEAWTTRIVELSPAESSSVLSFLFEHVKSMDFNLRWRWSVNDVAMWDNLAVQHYAVPDYDSERIVQRVQLAGDQRPRGPGDRGKRKK
jgi:alpha-ketoglutarate-dependent taurine dioxygenase